MSARRGRRSTKNKRKKAEAGAAGSRLAGTTAAFALAAAAGSVLGYLGEQHWTLDLLAQFRVQYTAILVASSLAFLALRRPAWSGLALAAAVAAGAPVLAHRLVEDVRCRGATPGLRVLALHLPAEGARPGGVAAAIAAAAPDVVFAMAVTPAWAEALGAELEEGYAYQVWEPMDDGFGVGLLSRTAPLEAGIAFLGTSLPSVVATVEDEGGSAWTVIGTHAQLPLGEEATGRRDLQLEALAARVRGTLEPTVVVGNLSTTPWAASFEGLLASSGLQDGGQGGWPLGTWGPYPLLRVPTDHVLISRELCVVEWSTGPAVGSGHLPVSVELARR